MSETTERMQQTFPSQESNFYLDHRDHLLFQHHSVGSLVIRYQSTNQDSLGCVSWCWTAGRVLARISKMPVQNSNSKISAHPDLATQLLQILITTTFNSLLCQKEQFTLQPCQTNWFVWKIFDYKLPPKSQNWKYAIETFACPKDKLYGSWLSPWLVVLQMAVAGPLLLIMEHLLP